MNTLLIAAVMCAAVTVSAEDTKLGAGVTLKAATPISALTAKPADYVGKTIRIDGIATAVCEEMGCWVAVKADDSTAAAETATVRLKVEDGVIVFPLSAKGKKVSAEGVFEQVGANDAESKEAAGEHARKDPKASAVYQIKATGAIIR